MPMISDISHTLPTVINKWNVLIISYRKRRKHKKKTITFTLHWHEWKDSTISDKDWVPNQNDIDSRQLRLVALCCCRVQMGRGRLGQGLLLLSHHFPPTKPSIVIFHPPNSYNVTASSSNHFRFVFPHPLSPLPRKGRKNAAQQGGAVNDLWSENYLSP